MKEKENEQTMKKQIRRCSTQIQNSIENKQIVLATDKGFLSFFHQASKLLFHLEVKTISLYFEIYLEVDKHLSSIYDHFNELSKVKSLGVLFMLASLERRIVSRVYMQAVIAQLYKVDLLHDSKCQKEFIAIFNELMFNMKKIDTPINGLFARYFLISNLKEQFNVIDTNQAATFLLENFIEMNSLFKQITNTSPKDKEIGLTWIFAFEENLNCLLALPGLNRELFRNKFIAHVIPLIYDVQALSYQEYIIEWVTKGLPEDYIIISLEKLIPILVPLYIEIDPFSPKKIKHILNRVLIFFKKTQNKDQELLDIIHQSYKTIKDQLMKLLEKAKSPLELTQYLELIETITNYIIIACNNQDKGSALNAIYNLLTQVLNEKQKQITEIHIKTYDKIIKSVSEAHVRIFDIPHLYTMTKYFKEPLNKKYNVSILCEIIDQNEEINNCSILTFVVELIKKMLDIKSAISTGKYDEHTIIQSIIKLAHSSNPETKYRQFLILNNIFDKRDYTIMKPSISSLYKLLLNHIKDLEMSYLSINNLLQPNDSIVTFKQLDMAEYPTEQILMNHICDLYKTMIACMNSKYEDYADANVNFSLEVLTQMNQMKIGRKKIKKSCEEFILFLIKNLKNGKWESQVIKNKIIDFINVMLIFSLLNKEEYIKVIEHINCIVELPDKRIDTVRASIALFDLYMREISTERQNLIILLDKTFKEATISLVRFENYTVFNELLARLLDYIDIGYDFVSIEMVNKIIKSLQDFIPLYQSNNEAQIIITNIKELGVRIKNAKEEKKNALYEQINNL